MQKLALITLGNTAVADLECLADALSVGVTYGAACEYLNCRFGSLTASLEGLKYAGAMFQLEEIGDRLYRVFMRLHESVAAEFANIKRETPKFFRRIGCILRDLFTRGKRNRVRGALVIRERVPDYWCAVIDRVTDILRLGFVRLREFALVLDKLRKVPLGPIALGAYARTFVECADTSTGVLIMKFQDNHRELFNLTAAEWRTILPLLTSPHAQGYAKLEARPQSTLTRHDADGNERRDGLAKLKLYIHPVHLGRGGSGEYFLAPYPRRRNVVG